MTPAAVGFQCPDCVREATRGSRQARTPYGGRRPGNPVLTSQLLIGLNVAVWLLITVTGGASSGLVNQLALLPQGARFQFPDGTVHDVEGVADGAFWQPLTAMFTHVDLWHIGFNMLALWFLGPQLEVTLGRVRFLAVYLLSGLAGSALVYWLAGVHSSTAGASGAVFGLMGALLVVAVKVRADPRQILIWVGLNFVITVIGRGFISWQGHLGGFLGGVLLAAILVYAPRRGRPIWQAVGLGVFAVFLMAAFLLRTAQLS